MKFHATTCHLAAALLALGASAASAQTLPTPAPTKVYDSATTPQLIGLDGVSVLGQTFDVRFIGGQSCAQTFSGCDSVDDLTFKTVEGAEAASRALMSALSPGDLPNQSVFWVATPHTVSNTQAPGYPVEASAYGVSVGVEMVIGKLYGVTQATNKSTRFAVWTPAVTAVPEPGTYALMLAGLGAVGFTARRRRSA